VSKDDNQVMVQSEEKESNKDQVKLTVKEAAEAIGESAVTVRNWMRELKPYIPLKKAENGYNLFDAEALEIIRQIKKLHREQGYSINQVKTYFDSGGELFKPVNTEEQMQKDIEELKEKMRKQKEFNEVLVRQLKNQQTYIDDKLKEQDHRLTAAMKEHEEATLKRLAPAIEEKTEEKPKRKGFFRRLFS
jgi:DNA-binding transcriptional MerR regulator